MGGDRRELPGDFDAALDRHPEARDRFATLPAQRQNERLDWTDRGRGRRGRTARIDLALRRLVPRERWPWLLLLLLLVVGALLAYAESPPSSTTDPAAKSSSRCLKGEVSRDRHEHRNNAT